MSISNEKRDPDFVVMAMNKDTRDRNPKIGSAWENDDGSIAISLLPYIKLESNRSLVIMLFDVNTQKDRVTRTGGAY